MKEPSLLSTAYKLRRAHLRRRGAGRVDLPQHREAQAPARRVVQARDRRLRRRLRDGRDAAPLLLDAEEAHGRLDPRRRRAQELHAAGRAAARPDPRRAHRTASTSTCSSASTRWTTARSARAPPGEGHTWGKVSAAERRDRQHLRARRRDRGLPVAHLRAAQRPEDEAQARGASTTSAPAPSRPCSARWTSGARCWAPPSTTRYVARAGERQKNA